METKLETDFLPFGLYSTSIFVLAIVAATLTLSLTLVKIWVSWIQRLRFFLSDHFAIASSVILLGSLGLVIYYISLPMTLYGSPSDPEPGSEEEVEYLRAAFVIEILWPTSLGLSKLSILLLFRRMFFSIQLRVIVVCTIIFVAAMYTAMVFGTVFQCSPVSFWNDSLPNGQAHCINRQIFFLFSNVPNIVANAVILVLPTWELKHLRIGRPVKVFLWAIFLLGSTAVAASVVRFVEIAMINGSDSRDSRIAAGAAVIVEATVAMLCAYLPTLCPALWRMRPSRANFDSSHASGWNRAGPPSKRHYLENYDEAASRLTGGRRWPLSRARHGNVKGAKPLPREPSNEFLRSLASLSTTKENGERSLGGIWVEKEVTTKVERRSQIEPALQKQLQAHFGSAGRGSRSAV